MQWTRVQSTADIELMADPNDNWREIDEMTMEAFAEDGSDDTMAYLSENGYNDGRHTF